MAPKPLMLASVSNMKGFLKSGYANRGAVNNSALSILKACWQLTVQQNDTFFLVKQYSGSAIFA